MREPTKTTFNILRAAEGGMGQREALRRLKKGMLASKLRALTHRTLDMWVLSFMANKRILARADSLMARRLPTIQLQVG